MSLGCIVVSFLFLLELVFYPFVLPLNHVNSVIFAALIFHSDYASCICMLIFEFLVTAILVPYLAFDLVTHLLLVDELGFLNFAFLGYLHVVETSHLLLARAVELLHSLIFLLLTDGILQGENIPHVHFFGANDGLVTPHG